MNFFSGKKTTEKLETFVEATIAPDSHQNPLGSFAQIIHVSRTTYARF